MDHHDLSIIKSSLANHEISANDLLTNLDWKSLLESPDPFCVFAASQLFHQIIKSNTTIEALKIWIESAVNQVYADNSAAYLELFHSLFKRTRKLNGIEAGNLTLDPGYILLSVLASHPKTHVWVQSSLESRHQSRLVPTLVCLIDIVKLASLFEDKGSLGNLDQGLEYCQVIIDIIKSNLKQVYPHWTSKAIAVVRRSMELVRRLLENQGDNKMVAITLNAIVSYTDHLNHQGFSYDHLVAMQQVDRTEFFHEPIVTDKCALAVDRECLKQIISITFVSIYCLLDSSQPIGKTEMETMYGTFSEISKRLQVYSEQLPENGVLEILFDIYGNNDEDAIYQQICILDVFSSIEQPANHTNEPIENNRERLKVVCLLREILSAMDISPHNVFLYFLYKTGMDHEILVDLLISNETDFLSFFVRYLKYIARQPTDFVETCVNLLKSEDEDEDSTNGLEIISSIFHNLVSVLESEGFPYNPTALKNRILYVTDYIDNILDNTT
ncbi:lines N-terminus-domain-containing protein [Phycomyces nitens]|nr:lines N-terminus-domain-containing protein [Phycomyces nitens]